MKILNRLSWFIWDNFHIAIAGIFIYVIAKIVLMPLWMLVILAILISLAFEWLRENVKDFYR